MKRNRKNEWLTANKIDPRVYLAWQEMRRRCRDISRPYAKNYVLRGITVCKRWDSFKNFAADMGPHPGKGWSLERRDVNGNYEPSNCIWATCATQARNQRRNVVTKEKAALIREEITKLRIGRQRLHRGTAEGLAQKFGISVVHMERVARGDAWQ